MRERIIARGTNKNLEIFLISYLLNRSFFALLGVLQEPYATALTENTEQSFHRSGVGIRCTIVLYYNIIKLSLVRGCLGLYEFTCGREEIKLTPGRPNARELETLHYGSHMSPTNSFVCEGAFTNQLSSGVSRVLPICTLLGSDTVGLSAFMRSKKKARTRN